MRTAPRKPKIWNYDNFQQRYLAFYAATKRRYARALARGRTIIEPTGSIWSITDTTSAVYGFLPEFRTPEYIAAHLANRAQGFGWYQANRVH